MLLLSSLSLCWPFLFLAGSNRTVIVARVLPEFPFPLPLPGSPVTDDKWILFGCNPSIINDPNRPLNNPFRKSFRCRRRYSPSSSSSSICNGGSSSTVGTIRIFRVESHTTVSFLSCGPSSSPLPSETRTSFARIKYTTLAISGAKSSRRTCPVPDTLASPKLGGIRRWDSLTCSLVQSCPQAAGRS